MVSDELASLQVERNSILEEIKYRKRESDHIPPLFADDCSLASKVADLEQQLEVVQQQILHIMHLNHNSSTGFLKDNRRKK